MKTGFKGWMDFGRQVLLFRGEAYSAHAARDDVLWRGLAVLVVVTLAAGLLPFLVGLIGDWARPDRPPEWLFSNQPPSVEELLGPAAEFVPLPPDLDEMIEEYFDPSMLVWVRMGFRIAELPTLMPAPISTLLENLAAYLSTPFQRLSSWMFYSLVVLLIARLMGGTASAARMLGTTALFSIPHVLDLFSFVPCLGGVLGLVAALWGLAIYIKAVAVSNEFSTGRAVLVTALPALIAFVLGLVIAVLWVVLIAVASG